MSEEQLDMIENDQEETAAIPTEQTAFINQLEAEEAAAELDPEQAKLEEKAAEKQADFDKETAGITAAMGLGTIEFALRRVVHPDFEFTESTKAYAIENLSPVLIKYGAIVPGWLSQYDAEIKAAMAVGKLAADGIDTAHKLKKADAEKAEAAKEEKERVRVAA
ncbi:hypothetical protein [Marinomonas algicola]|uniref:hypothetical protein n=1 Tax=Marinomonas algicola TaxID=2773454 RepID=UPI00174E90EF|nr:hypothetical protein [Marinomonas algicola]